MSSPGQETLRGAFPLNSSLSLDHASLLRRDALLSPLNLNLNLSPPPLPKFLGGEEQDQQDESDIELDESKEDVPVEEPKDSGETEEEESSDVQEEEKSRNWADQVEEEKSRDIGEEEKSKDCRKWCMRMYLLNKEFRDQTGAPIPLGATIGNGFWPGVRRITAVTK